MTSSRQSLHPSSPTPSIPPPSLSLHHSPLPAQVRLQESHFPRQNLRRENQRGRGVLELVIGPSVFTYSCSYVQVAWIQRLMAITYWPMQKVRILSGFSHRCCQRKVRYNAAVVSGRYGTTPLLSAEGPAQKAESTVQRLRHP